MKIRHCECYWEDGRGTKHACEAEKTSHACKVEVTSHACKVHETSQACEAEEMNHAYEGEETDHGYEVEETNTPITKLTKRIILPHFRFQNSAFIPDIPNKSS